MTTLAAGSGVSPVQTDLLIVLACAGVISLLLSRLRVAVIPGYLLAGVLIGPSGLGFVSSPERVEQISSLALIVLMFSIGMHLDSTMLRKGAASIVSIGVATTLTATALGWGLLALTPMSGPGALATAMGLAMSSTSVVLQLLSQRRKMHTTTGRASLGVLLIQDLIVIAYLAAIPLLAASVSGEGEQRSLGQILPHALLAMGGVGVIIVLGRLVLPRVMREAARFGGNEVMLVLAGASALGAGLLTASLGLSAELGAFIAGFMLSSTPFRHQLTGQLAPVRDLFLAVFFTAIGLQVDLEALAPVWWVVPAGAAALMLFKFLNIAVVAWAVGAETALAARLGLTLAQAGEFSLIVFAVAQEAGLLRSAETSVLIGIVIASLVVTPPVMQISPRVGAFFQKRVGRPPWLRGEGMTEDESGPHDPPEVIIGGFGVMGRTCADLLEERGVRCSVIEMNQETVRAERAKGRRIMFGDVSNHEVLESAGIEHARVAILSLPDSDATMRAIRSIRSISQDIHIAVRVSLEPRRALAEGLGADEVVVEESVAATVLAAHVLGLCQPDLPPTASEAGSA
jgi:Kef-type K+ transport system membrane component KefB